MGSINIHVVHHIFPDVCHVHYPKLTSILIKTCEEYGLEYKEYKTFREAFAAHIGMLKHLSKADAEVPDYNPNLSLAS
jgi:linoleoyl-CoA desaturase